MKSNLLHIIEHNRALHEPRLNQDRKVSEWIWRGVLTVGIVVMLIYVQAALSFISCALGAESSAHLLSVTVEVVDAPVSIETPDDGESVTITAEEIAAWCEEFGLFTGECVIDPAEVRSFYDEDAE